MGGKYTKKSKKRYVHKKCTKRYTKKGTSHARYTYEYASVFVTLFLANNQPGLDPPRTPREPQVVVVSGLDRTRQNTKKTPQIRRALLAVHKQVRCCVYSTTEYEYVVRTLDGIIRIIGGVNRHTKRSLHFHPERYYRSRVQDTDKIRNRKIWPGLDFLF